MELDPAIPPHLQTERTQPLNTPPNYQPPVPAYAARFPKSTKELVMAIFGAQAKVLPKGVIKPILGLMNKENKDAPRFWDMATAQDSEGFETQVVISYWDSKASYSRWYLSSGFESWWQTLHPNANTNGWFKEVFFPPIERFETVFSDNTVPEGAAHLRESVSGPMLEHVYWGSMRDRLPAAQTDALDGNLLGAPQAEKIDTASKRIKVQGQKNLCVIRSGQDWSVTRPEERKLYLETMHPVLEKGMYFLRDEGSEIGCIENRLMSVLDTKTLNTGTDKTFGLGYFDSMGSLEKWSREHQTHLEIFGGFLKYVKQLNNDYTLRLFHEVLVLQPEQQDLEYVGCHPKTGLLSVGSNSWVM